MCTDENTVRWVRRRVRRAPDSPRTRGFPSTSAYIAARHSPSSIPNARLWTGNTASVRVAASTRRRKRTGSVVPARRPDWKGGASRPQERSDQRGLSSEWMASAHGLTASWPSCPWASYLASNMMQRQTPADAATAHAQAGQPAWSILKISSYFLLTSIIAIGKSAVILLVPPLIQVSSIWRYISYFRGVQKKILHNYYNGQKLKIIKCWPRMWGKFSYTPDEMYKLL